MMYDDDERDETESIRIFQTAVQSRERFHRKTPSNILSQIKTMGEEDYSTNENQSEAESISDDDDGGGDSDDSDMPKKRRALRSTKTRSKYVLIGIIVRILGSLAPSDGAPRGPRIDSVCVPCLKSNFLGMLRNVIKLNFVVLLVLRKQRSAIEK